MCRKQFLKFSITYNRFIRSSHITTIYFKLIPKLHQSFGASTKLPAPTQTKNLDRLMFQMHIYITVALLWHSAAVSAGLENILALAEFIADIYQQFPHSSIFNINPKA
jgi:hypothetical protein